MVGCNEIVPVIGDELNREKFVRTWV